MKNHLPHLYEDHDLTVGQLKEILTLAAQGRIEGTEKIDGQNLKLSFLPRAGEVRVARNAGDLKKGGITRNEISERYKNHPALDGFLMAIDTWQECIEELPEDMQLDVFGQAELFYNCEVVNPDSPNVFVYKQPMLALHRDGHLKLVNGEPCRYVDDESLAILGYLFDLQKNKKMRPFLKNKVTLPSLKDKVVLSQTISQIDNFGVSDDDTLQVFMSISALPEVKRSFPGLPGNIQEMIAERLSGKSSLREIYKWLNEDEKKQVGDFVKSYKPTRSVLAEILESFSQRLLEESSSELLAENQIEGIQERIYEEIKRCEALGDQKKLDALDEALRALGDMSNIPMLEGYVFEYGGKTYKMTGKFPAVNKILAMNRYNQKGRHVAVFPGKFKPPHLGHWSQIQEMLKRGADEVIVIISPISVGSVTAEKSRRILEMFSKGDERIKISISSQTSPVRETFGMVNEMTEGDIFTVGVGSKDSDKRFDKLPEWATENMPGVMIEIHSGEQNSGGISGTQMRKSLQSGEKSSFLQGLPEHLNNLEKQKIWEILTR